ncbi:MAG: BatD family protein [Planctomycetota bacterium]|jgi:hypothetical protein
MRQCVHSSTGLIALALALWPGATTRAQAESTAESDAPPARVDLVPPVDERLWMGQRIPFAIDLMVLDTFAGTATFYLPDVQGVILMKVSGSPAISMKKIGDDEYTVQRHEFVLFVQEPGQIRISEIPVRFASARILSKERATHELSSDSFALKIAAPPGRTPGEVTICTSDFSIDDRWSGDIDSLSTGDALKRTVTMRAGDVPAMLLPALSTSDIEGLGLYRDKPQLQDRENRGALTGERKEILTYVCQEQGTYTIPESRIRWWDPKDETWKEHLLESRTLTVLAGTEAAANAATTSEEVPAGLSAAWWLMAAAIIVFGVVGGWWVKVAQQSRQAKNSEHALFADVQRACRKHKVGEAYRALSMWLPHWSLQTHMLGQLPETSAAALHHEVVHLQTAMLQPDNSWDGSGLARALAKFRRQRLRRRRDQDQALPVLNPT